MQCDQCGTILHKDDARFCANCGATIGERERNPSQSPKGNDAPLSSAPPKHDPKKPLREQVARQPSAASVHRKLEGRSSGVNHVASDGQSGNAMQATPESGDALIPDLETQHDLVEVQPGADASSPEAVKSRQAPVSKEFERKRSAVNWPAPITHVALTDTPETSKEVVEPAAAKPVTRDQLANSVKSPPAETPKRELHVKVWKQPDPVSSPDNKTGAPSTTSDAEELSTLDISGAGVDQPGDPENQPTRPLGPSETPTRADAVPTTFVSPEEEAVTALEQIDTMQLSVQPEPDTMQTGAQPHRSPITPLPSPLKLAARSRGPLLLSAVLLPILIIGGLSLWIGLAQPFSVSPVTQPWQNYNDPSLGMSFIYPNDWSQQIDRNKSMVQFNDSSHTAQFSIVVANTSSGSLNQFAQQQAKQSGLTTTKAASSLTFGGATWQQVQGNTQISGANYSGRVLATTHGNRHYVIVQLAPLDTYGDEEKVIFAPMRAAWKFQS